MKKLRDYSGFLNSDFSGPNEHADALLQAPETEGESGPLAADRRAPARGRRLRVLIKRGYSVASTNRIAEAAGVSVGTLYEYFADKEAVFDALIQREIEALVAAIRNADLRADASLGVTLERLLRLAMAAMPRRARLHPRA